MGARELPGGHEASWFELTGAASASLTIHALFALAAEPTTQTREIDAGQASLLPVDLGGDDDARQLRRPGRGHRATATTATSLTIPSPELAAQRIGDSIERCLQEARSLPDGERHTLIVACMVAMYLSKDSARTPALRETTASLVGAGGSLTRLLLPIFALWRIAYAQRS